MPIIYDSAALAPASIVHCLVMSPAKDIYKCPLSTIIEICRLS